MQLSALTAGLSMALVLATASTRADAAEEWEFSLAPLFLWGLSIEGDATINGKTAPLDLEFKDDILDNMEGVFTLHFEARRGDWTLFTEYQWIDLEADVGAREGELVDASVDLGFEQTMWEFGATWAFRESASTRWELLMGARYMEQDVNLKIDLTSSIPALNQKLRPEAGDDWWQGIGGVRVFHALSDNWTFIGRTDLGYGGSDNSSINLVALFDYRFRDWGSAFVGYKYLEFDYETSDYGYDAKQQGPLVGLNFYW